MLEIERKYLVDVEKWQPTNEGLKIIQGYLSVDKERVVRVRIKGEKAFLTIKGNQQGITRTELEYEIPVNEAQTMLEMCLDYPIEKTRYTQQVAGLLWEIDVFDGANSGLYLAEVELENETQYVELPEWIKEEVSHNHRYFNSWLSQNPFIRW
ncbi:CYTH domain-containing protein [Prolixibacteraceae bacterium Z1-6]|uniref:CYTH domain-containing protein n=1 Tax=Draconibacterium aestuarii TaxID=2998507 RepID=A0A9X3F7V8_9BACT|nr:CYTH domain-containing protein [Prolixibacteraceae bacterium Z1-6]